MAFSLDSFSLKGKVAIVTGAGARQRSIGAAYAGFTLQSALDFWRGRGGLWKGRVQAMAGDA